MMWNQAFQIHFLFLKILYFFNKLDLIFANFEGGSEPTLPIITKGFRQFICFIETSTTLIEIAGPEPSFLNHSNNIDELIRSVESNFLLLVIPPCIVKQWLCNGEIVFHFVKQIIWRFLPTRNSWNPWKWTDLLFVFCFPSQLNRVSPIIYVKVLLVESLVRVVSNNCSLLITFNWLQKEIEIACFCLLLLTWCLRGFTTIFWTVHLTIL